MASKSQNSSDIVSPPETSSAESPSANNLLSLSNELLSIIASFCHPLELCALARTCHRLYDHASPKLHESVVIRSLKAIRGLTLSHALYGPRLLHHVRTFEAHLPWFRPKNVGCRLIDVVEHMGNLEHLFIEYDYSVFDEDQSYWTMYLPPRLTPNLVSCTLDFKCYARWRFEDAILLFQHPQIRMLELHWARTDCNSLSRQAISQRETPLEDLKLIDCEFSASDLNAILQCPRTLRTLSICSAIDNDDLFDNEEVDHEEFFLAISQSRSGKSLEGFRLDFQHRHYTIVPAPGMDKFLHVKYLEVHPEHLHNKATWHEEYPIPDIDCPIERLLPPNLEVLKITFYDAEEDENIVCDILERKADIVPSLRRIVLTQHYRDREMAEELRKAVAKETDRRNYARANSVISDDFPCHIWRDPMTVLKSHCKREGVEMMLLWEDSARKEILREGAGPNLWELSSQIVVSPEPDHAEETARSWRNLYGLE